MKRKYNKKVLGQVSLTLENREITAFYTKDGEYFNIHILDPKFQDDEMNTLKLQEPEEHEPNDKVLYEQLWEHFIWEKMYGVDGSMFGVGVDLEQSEL